MQHQTKYQQPVGDQNISSDVNKVTFPINIIRMKDLPKKLGASRSKAYELTEEDDFPESYHLYGGRERCFIESEVDEYLLNKINNCRLNSCITVIGAGRPTLAAIPFTIGGVEATASTEADIPVTSMEVTGDAAIPVQQSAGNQAVPVDSDAAGHSTTGDSIVVLPVVPEPAQQPQTEVVAPQPVPAKAKVKRSSKGKAAHARASEDMPNPGILNSLVRRLFSGHLMWVNARFMTYRGGRWVALKAKSEVRPAIARHFGHTTSIVEINEILGQLMFRYASATFPPLHPDLICLNNGTLNPLTGELHAHSPEFYLRHKVNISWDADAACPWWERFLDEIFRDDTDKEQKIRLVQQWFGYCLIPSTERKKMLMLIGDGENGKSVLLNILMLIVGMENTSNIQLERFGRAEVRAELEGKLLNISPELTDKAWLLTGYMKDIVVGNEIEARRLYGYPISFKPTARVVVSTNNLSRVCNLSNGFCRKIIMLTFNRQFTDADRDRQLEVALLAELPGILAWAVRGLQDLVQDGEFITPPSSNVAKLQCMVESEDARLFLDECLELDPEGAVLPASVDFSNYRRWARESGRTSMNDNTFYKKRKLAGLWVRNGVIQYHLVPSESNPEQPQQEVNMAT